MRECKKQIAVVGDGAIGFALTALWRQKKTYDVLIFGRDGLSKKKKKVSLFREDPVTVEQRTQVNLDVSVWVFATKAYDLATAVAHARPFIKRDALVVSLSNGYVKDSFLGATAGLSSEVLRIGVTTFGARETSDGAVFVTNEAGVVVWGPLRAGVSETALELELARGLIGFSWQEDAMPTIRMKWLANVVINGLCAAEKLASNGALMAHTEKVRQAITEAYRLGEDLWGAWPEAPAYYEAQIFALIKTTAENENSMVRDLKLGRKTEAAYLFGLAGDNPQFPLLRWINKSVLS